MKKGMILFNYQKNITPKEEVEVVKKLGIPYAYLRTECKDSLVVSRFAGIMDYSELCADLKNLNAEVVNSTWAHQYVANFDYYHDVAQYTFKTYFDGVSVPETGGPFVVKGRNHSKKQEWSTKMFAPTKRDAMIIASELRSDSMISSEDIVFREFMSLEIIDTGINGLPMANEWRFFFYKNQKLAHGFYWVSTDKRGQIDNVGLEFAQTVANTLVEANEELGLFVIDIARNAKGQWVLVEMNDGQMSGLTDCDPEEFYSNLKKYVFSS